jgi:hypothetical protein
MVGMVSPRFGAIDLLGPEDPQNRVIREAASIARLADGDVSLRRVARSSNRASRPGCRRLSLRVSRA